MNSFHDNSRHNQRIEPIWRYEDARAFSTPEPVSISSSRLDGARSSHQLIHLGALRPGEPARSVPSSPAGIIVLRVGDRQPGSF